MRGSPGFRLSLLVLVTISLMGLAAAARAADAAYYDEAKVTRVEPVVRRIPTTVSRTRCHAGLPPSTRLESEYPDLKTAIVSESGRLTRPRCRPMTETAFREEITGYRVVYRYDGIEYVRTLPYDPGETLRVRISVRPHTR